MANLWRSCVKRPEDEDERSKMIQKMRPQNTTQQTPFGTKEEINNDKSKLDREPLKELDEVKSKTSELDKSLTTGTPQE